MTYPTKRIRNTLLSKGFAEEPTHHIVFRLIVAGQRTEIRTHLSHGVREYGSSLLAQVAKQMGLRRKELDDFLRCPMDHEEYVRLLVQRGLLAI